MEVTVVNYSDQQNGVRPSTEQDLKKKEPIKVRPVTSDADKDSK